MANPTKPEQQPLFDHDCDLCQFLGTYRHGDRAPHDLYTCDGEGTLIARFSSNGPDYVSGFEFGLKGKIPELVEALNRAVVRYPDSKVAELKHKHDEKMLLELVDLKHLIQTMAWKVRGGEVTPDLVQKIFGDGTSILETMDDLLGKQKEG